MKNYFFSFALLIPSLFINAQTLSEQMWQRVNSCYANFEDMDDDGKVDYDELIDDSKNGYLKISGYWPTCGCGCTSTVGAFKDSNGNFTFLQKDTYSCSWVYKISSNKAFKELFPRDLNIRTFIPIGRINTDPTKASFYLDIEIPRYGTDTKVTLKPIPFGLNVTKRSHITYAYSEGENISSNSALWRIKQIAEKLQDENSLNLLLTGYYNRIQNKDLALINEAVGDDASRFISKEAISKQLQEIYGVYEMYTLIIHEVIILGWDREKARFFIKSKGDKAKEITFKQFLLNMDYWSPLC